MEVTRGMSLSGEYYSTEGELMRLTLGNFDYHKNCFKEDKSKENLYFTGDVKEGFILNKDDIVTPLTEQAIGLLGSTAKIPCSGKYIQSQDVGLIKCNEKLNPDYAFYLIPSKLVRNQLSAAAQQTKIRHTSPDKIKGCTVWIPEYDKQEKIGKLLSSLDDKIALNNRINAKLEQMAKRLYDYWFVQFNFPITEEYAKSHPELVSGSPYKSNGGKMVWNEELKREIPEGWEVKKLGDLFTTNRGVSYSTATITGDGGIPMINLASFSPDGTYKVSGLKLFTGEYTKEKVFLLLVVSMILINFAGWAFYYTGHQYGWLIVVSQFAAVPLYYLCFGLWKSNYPLVGTATIFFIIHNFFNSFTSSFERWGIA